jgi:hypothetical protein
MQHSNPASMLTDTVLEQILRQLVKQPNSVMLFVSDHAERFYENGVDSCGSALLACGGAKNHRCEPRRAHLSFAALVGFVNLVAEDLNLNIFADRKIHRLRMVKNNC